MDAGRERSNESTTAHVNSNVTFSGDLGHTSALKEGQAK